jgi:tetratricopeptide (TPR) repeat protein
LAVGVGAVCATAIAVAAVIAFTRPTAPSPTASPAAARSASPEPLADARRRLESGDLDGAQRRLTEASHQHDGADLQELMGELALRRSRLERDEQGRHVLLLRALQNLHRATRLSPREAAPHAHLAALLVELGQHDHACREAHAALALDPRSPIAQAAATAARCDKETR